MRKLEFIFHSYIYLFVQGFVQRPFGCRCFLFLHESHQMSKIILYKEPKKCSVSHLEKVTQYVMPVKDITTGACDTSSSLYVFIVYTVIKSYMHKNSR